MAASVAAREGLAAPVPITACFDAVETDETGWQQLVVEHLGIDEWITVDIGDELDLLGPLGRAFLLRHGLRYPQTPISRSPCSDGRL